MISPTSFVVYPAIDMLDGQVVRLQQGRRDQVTVYNDSIAAQAEAWVEQGAKALHLVDLSGAFDGQTPHFAVITQIKKQFPQLEVQVGGGIRSLDRLKAYLDCGVDGCILGTVVIQNPSLVQEWIHQWPHRIVLGLDARHGQIVTHGWQESSPLRALDVAKNFEDLPVRSIVYTDVSRDGMLQHMNVEDTLALAAAQKISVVASGGLTDLQDIAAFVGQPNLRGVIAGKAIYEGRFTLSEALEKVRTSC